MGWFSDGINALKSVLLLEHEVKRLGNNTAKLAEHFDQMRMLVVRLDAQQKDAAQLATQAAQLAVNNDITSLRERVLKIEMFLAQQSQPATPPLLLSRSQSHDARGVVSDSPEPPAS